LIELNFERLPNLADLFSENNPEEILKNIEAELATTINPKYGGEIDAGLLNKIMLSVAEQLGNKFVYSRIIPAGKMSPVKKAFTKLSQAKVCTKILHTAGNGLPLGAESNEKFFKTLMVDIGLISVQLGLSSIKHSE